MREFIIPEDYVEGGYLELEFDYIERECQELIRCKDCKWWKFECYCDEKDAMVEPCENDYCSRAERKGEE